MILVEGLTKHYGDVRAVDGLSFRVDSGQVVGFLGPNGAGKSTTMRMLVGFAHADAGRIEIAGQEVDPEVPASRRAIGYLPETTPLYSRMGVAEYLDFAGRMRGLRRDERGAALERVLADCGLEGWARRKIRTLSRGYRQRVGLAQALIGDPEVLVLDEPTSGLDPAEITRIRALVRTLGERKTILLSTHILTEVQEVCRRVIILAGGRIVADGSTVDLAAEEAVELVVTLRGAGRSAGTDTADELAGLPEVDGVRSLGADAAGRARYALAVRDPGTAAEAVYEAARARGWVLSELRHDLPSLERVFLERTETRAFDAGGASPEDGG